MGVRLAGRRAIVTGAADGMGEAIATLFAAEGAQVLAVDIQADRLESAHAGNSAITTMVQDLAEDDAATNVVARAQAVFGGIDILINNAGIRGKLGPIQNATDAQWDRIMNINLQSLFRLSRAASPHLIAASSGRIINVGSVQGKLASPSLGPYVVSKHAVLGLTRSFALDLGPHGVTVNCIMPGFIETGLTRNVKADAPAVYDRLVEKIVLGRPGQPIEIANLALFLSSEESSFITGACIPVDGGMTAWG